MLENNGSESASTFKVDVEVVMPFRGMAFAKVKTSGDSTFVNALIKAEVGDMHSVVTEYITEKLSDPNNWPGCNHLGVEINLSLTTGTANFDTSLYADSEHPDEKTTAVTNGLREAVMKHIQAAIERMTDHLPATEAGNYMPLVRYIKELADADKLPIEVATALLIGIVAMLDSKGKLSSEMHQEIKTLFDDGIADDDTNSDAPPAEDVPDVILPDEFRSALDKLGIDPEQ